MIILAAVWCLLLAKTFFVQVIQNTKYAAQIEEQSMDRRILFAERGRIKDRNGEILVDNIKKKTLVNGRHRLIKRLMTHGELAAHTLGKLGTDDRGKMGIEYSLNDQLSGNEGWENRKLDVHRSSYDGFISQKQDPTPGMDVVLTIDHRIQKIVESALKKGVEKVKAIAGTSIVVNPHNGEILALANYPTVDHNNSFHRSQVRNDAVEKSFEPGSTMKVITTAIALEEGKVDLKEQIDVENGEYHVCGKKEKSITDHDAHEYLNLEEVLAHSSNIGYAKIAQRVEKETFFRYFRAFGFGTKTGVELPGESQGTLKPLRDWNCRTQATMSYGHAIAVNPLQMTMALSSIANGGKLFRPKLVKAYQNAVTGEIISENHDMFLRRVVSEETAETTRELMKSVIEYGTAKTLKIEGVSFSGKTGTAEKYDAELKRWDFTKNNSSFVAFLPADQPQYVIYTVLDEPSLYTSGAKAAGPVFKDIAHRMSFDPNYGIASQFFNHEDYEAIGVPNFVNKTLSEVKKWAKMKGIGVKSDSKGELVIAQFPSQLTLSSDSNSIYITTHPKWEDKHEFKKIPNLKGMSLRQALNILKERGFKAQFEGRGVIQTQRPLPGKEVKSDRPVRLVLSEVKL